MSKAESELTASPRRSWDLLSWARLIITIAVALLPIFFLPFWGLPPEAAKRLLLGLAVLVAALLWLWLVIRDKTISIPKTFLVPILGIIPLVYFISALASGTIRHSLIGMGLEYDTFFAMAVAAILAFLVAQLFQNKNRILAFFGTLLAGALLVFLFQVIRLSPIGNLFNLLQFTNPVSNLIGKWNSLGIFFGLTSLVSLIGIEFLPRPRSRSISLFLGVSLVASLLGVFFVNFYMVWIVVALGSFLILLIGREAGSEERQAPKFSFRRRAVWVLIIAVVFAFLGAYGYAKWPSFDRITPIHNALGIAVIEVRPSLSSTLLIAQETLKTSPIFGVGPANFSNAWLQHKPAAEVNPTPFWNVDFDAGYGTIPSAAVTTGLLGILAWLALLGILVYTFAKVWYTVRNNQIQQLLVVLTGLSSLYLLIFAFLYPIDIVLFTLLFVMLGAFVAVLADEKLISEWKFSLAQTSSRGSLAFSGTLVAFVVVALLFVLSLGSSVAALAYQYGSYTSVVRGDLASAEKSISFAAGLTGTDTFYRSLADIDVAKLNLILNDAKLTPEQRVAAFKPVLDDTVIHSSSSIAYNPKNYLNWLGLAQIYELLVPLKIEGAYEASVEKYRDALSLNPSNPALYLALARLEYAKGNVAESKQKIEQALRLKSNYSDAVFLLAQIEADNDNLDGAVAELEKAVGFAPNDAGVWFQLGFFHYRNENYRSARDAFKKAIELTAGNQYANAQYFLGLSYDKLGLPEEALKEFEMVAASNPNNAELAAIIENLKAGRPALSQKAAAAPEKKTTAPIEED